MRSLAVPNGAIAQASAVESGCGVGVRSTS
jgi:hypothetical protein